MNQRRSRRDTRNYRRSFSNLNNHIVYRRKGLKTCYLQEEQSEVPKREYLFSRYANPVFKYDSSRNDNRGNFYHNLPSTFNEPEEDIYETGSPETFYIETAVFVDRDLLRLMEINFPRDTEEQVIEVVLAMVNAVQLLYNDLSLGHKIKYVLKRLELLYQDPPGLSRPADIDLFLTKFCMWQNTENPPSDDENLHWDHALILTGLDLYTIMDDRKLNSQVVGLAPVAGMCTRTSSCTVNEGRHFESVYVVAHEIGHNLGMRHDGLQSGNNCDPSTYLDLEIVITERFERCVKSLVRHLTFYREGRCA
ncbi:A disintegrin and metalloproteinase with thrombospondin motifs 16 [Armadillidium nasatum]|uniref:A disintegrin and metalloproteinase with thrombospondin motifs 16 n=1 Tax=Armadillidium nasatum TaxID=96803 RepID=A0A5N5SU66_9CRUS|nr:A disintegrin and metalloproteinase with thrombospondin motifs 16 [Armadillidium nasatum]